MVDLSKVKVGDTVVMKNGKSHVVESVVQHKNNGVTETRNIKTSGSPVDWGYIDNDYCDCLGDPEIIVGHYKKWFIDGLKGIINKRSGDDWDTSFFDIGVNHLRLNHIQEKPCNNLYLNVNRFKKIYCFYSQSSHLSDLSLIKLKGKDVPVFCDSDGDILIREASLKFFDSYHRFSNNGYITIGTRLAGLFVPHGLRGSIGLYDGVPAHVFTVGEKRFVHCDGWKAHACRDHHFESELFEEVDKDDMRYDEIVSRLTPPDFQLIFDLK